MPLTQAVTSQQVSFPVVLGSIEPFDAALEPFDAGLVVFEPFDPFGSVVGTCGSVVGLVSVVAGTAGGRVTTKVPTVEAASQTWLGYVKP